MLTPKLLNPTDFPLDQKTLEYVIIKLRALGLEFRERSLLATGQTHDTMATVSATLMSLTNAFVKLKEECNALDGRGRESIHEEGRYPGEETSVGGGGELSP